ncbi:3-deoxy-7-phosphoheptulonate synthase, partial [Pseudomonas aeruginosa]|nr:3-deoxy-7-phosphoheptulonate synthase [Pseudomonas aeruginosa]
MDDLLQRVRRCEALQQPEWGDPSRLRDVQAYLRGSPALIRAGDILALRATLARVARATHQRARRPGGDEPDQRHLPLPA